MDPKLLYESPFIDFGSNGVEDVFERVNVIKLVEVLRDVEKRTAP